MDNETMLKWLGERIRYGRKEKKISLDALAVLCEIDKANLSRIEAGKINVTILTLNKIAHHIYGDLGTLFSNEK